MTKREPREITMAEIEQTFELASYWWGTKWCPAVFRRDAGFTIRILKFQVTTANGTQTTYDAFDLDPDGVVLVAPRGHAKTFKPGRVVDIAAVAARFVTPDPNAVRIALPW